MESLVGRLGLDGLGEVELVNSLDPGAAREPRPPSGVIPIKAAIAGQPIWTDPRLASLAKAQSDSVALSQAYQDSPASFLDYLSGQFALCIIDPSRGRSLLAVDRFGIGQLFWNRAADGTIRFGSDLLLLATQLPSQRRINPQAIYDYIYFHCVPSPNTVWQDIYKLGPAERLVWTGSNLNISRYWTPEFSRESDDTPSEADTMAALRRAVRLSVDSADTAGFLSGGLDSSTLCGMLQEELPDRAKAFTVSFDHDDYDELAYARLAATHFDLDHHVVNASTDATLDNLDRIFGSLNEPFGNSSVVPTFLCAVAARESGIGTLVAGDGGDELFAGNSRYAKQALFERYLALPQFLREALLEPLLLNVLNEAPLAPIRKVRRYVEQARIPLPARLETYNHLEIWGAANVFCDDFLVEVDTTQPLSLLEARYREPAVADTLDRMLYLDWKFTLADNDLRKVTSMCELAGVNVRFPFLDTDVVELSTRIPSREKLRGRKLRHFYKKSMRQYLPPEILAKSKHGFGLPFGEWLKTSKRLQETIYDHLSDLSSRDWVKGEFIAELIEHHRQGHAGFYGEAVWVFSALEMWCKTHTTDARQGS